MAHLRNCEQVIGDIISTHGNHSLIALLQEVQSRYNYLPEEALVLLSRKLEIPLSRVFSLATIEISFCEKPETATEIRKLFSPVRSML